MIELNKEMIELVEDHAIEIQLLDNTESPRVLWVSDSSEFSDEFNGKLIGRVLDINIGGGYRDYNSSKDLSVYLKKQEIQYVVVDDVLKTVDIELLEEEETTTHTNTILDIDMEYWLNDKIYMKVIYLFESNEEVFGYEVLYYQDGADNTPLYEGYESTIYSVEKRLVYVYDCTDEIIDFI